MPNILITGATGYVGRRLARRLLQEPGLRLRLLVRTPHKLEGTPLVEAEVIEGSTFDVDALASVASESNEAPGQGLVGIRRG